MFIKGLAGEGGGVNGGRMKGSNIMIDHMLRMSYPQDRQSFARGKDSYNEEKRFLAGVERY